jgi:gliding motility-associated-like protein
VAGGTLWLALISRLVCAQAPTISAVSSLQPVAGEVITLEGQNFPSAANLVVTLGQIQAEVLKADASKISLRVPAGSQPGFLQLINTSTRQVTTYPRPLSPTYRGQGNFELAKLTNVSLGTGASGIFQTTLADFNQDGLLDIASSANTANVVALHKNTSTTGAPAFQAQNIITNLNTRGITAGDLNGDGKPELVVGGNVSRSDILLIYPNLSSATTITFDTPLEYRLPKTGATRLLIQDLNNDGRPDIAVTDQSSNKLFIVENTGSSGSLSFAATAYELTFTGSSLYGLQITDVNGDGKPDILTNNNLLGKIFCSQNTSSGTSISFGSPTEIISSIEGAVEISVADFNNDTKPDIAWTNKFGNKVGYAYNNSTTSTLQFSAVTQFTVVDPWAISSGDINGDGLPDIVAQSGTSTLLTVLLNNGSSFTQHSLPISSGGQSVQIADLNRDARPDILYTLTATNGIQALMNQNCFSLQISESCAGRGVLLTTNYSPGATYIWKKDGTTVASGTNRTTYEASATGVYTVTVNPWGGCSQTASVTLTTISGMPGSPQFAPIAPICEGETLELKVNTSSEIAGATYEWRTAAGVLATTTESSYQIPNATQSNAVGYQVKITTSECEAVLSAVAPTIRSLPTTTISNTTIGACAGQTVTLRAANTSFAAYQWYKNGAQISGATSSSYSTNENGEYRVAVKDAQGCWGTSQNLIYTAPEALQPQFSVSSEICVNQPVQLTNTTPRPAGRPISYFWDFGDGNTSTAAEPEHSYTTAGQSYQVKLSVQYETFPFCPVESSTQTITVVAVPTASLAASRTVFCEGENTVVEVQSSQAIQAVSWSNGASGESITVSEGGTLTAYIETAAGCTLEKDISLEVIPKPAISVTAEKEQLNPGESTQLLTTGGSNLTYNWQPVTGLSDPSSANPIASPERTTEYTLTVTNENGCQEATSILISVSEEFKVEAPKLFVPPPGPDETWEVEGINFYPNVSLTIVNNLGQVILEAQPYQNTWDGTLNGQPLPKGTYYYIFKSAGGQVLKSGSITLIR